MSTIVDSYQNSEYWHRLVTLSDYAGRQLCRQVLHEKEGLPYDGAQLYRILEVYRDLMTNEDQKKVLCPSNGITDESKFDITLYTGLISNMFGSKYSSLVKDLRNYRNHLYHMGKKDMSESNFEDEWSSACFMLKRHGFTETVEDIKNGKKNPTILDFVERKTSGNKIGGIVFLEFNFFSVTFFSDQI